MEKQKNINRATIFFAILIFLYEVVSFLLIHADWFRGWFLGITVEQSILFSQGLILVPTIVYFIVTRQNIVKVLRLKRMHWATWFLLPILVLCMEPMMTVLNAISMLFVDNQIAGVSNELVQSNSLIGSLFFMAMLPAFIEESAYRGVILGNFREGNRLPAIIIAGCLFGIMHMNFNQMAYAIAMGIIFGFVVEATGSIFSTMLMHFCFNGISVVLSYLLNHLSIFKEQMQAQGETALTRQQILMSIQVYLPFAVVGTVAAAALIYGLAILNKNKESFLALFRQNDSVQIVEVAEPTTKKVHIITPLLVITVIYCIGKCIFDEFIAGP